MFNCYKPLTSTLGNEYPSSTETSKKNGTVRGDCIACDALYFFDFPSVNSLNYFVADFFAAVQASLRVVTFVCWLMRTFCIVGLKVSLSLSLSGFLSRQPIKFDFYS